MEPRPSHDPAIDRPLPAWFDDAKFGVFIHWSPAAVPAFAPPTSWLRYGDPEWHLMNPYTELYQLNMGVPDSPTARYHAGHHGSAPYDDFVAEFRDLLPRWDPESWAELFERAGARYVVLTVKLDDGFLLWPSRQPNPNKDRWQAERDVVGELAAAVRARGIRFGIYYSGVDFTFNTRYPDTPPDFPQVVSATPLRNTDYGPYVEAHWRELIERYEPSILWHDYGYPAGADPTPVFHAFRERVSDGVINDRFTDIELDESEVYSDFATVEREPNYETVPTDRKWEACRPIGASFGYNHLETDAVHYASSTVLLHELIDIVARGGNLLLNVGPTATGEVPWAQAKRFLAIGWWLLRFGDAIYGTRPWVRPAGRASFGLQVRYTSSDDAVHAIVLGTPPEARLELDVRLDPGAQVCLEDQPGPLVWTSTDWGVRISLPERPDEGPAFALRLSPRSAVRPA